jgi:thioredoxin reductase (NADPH)
MYDAAIIGGGPAGLTAALYLARFRLSVILCDAGNSRAALIPRTHNQPFWPDGISGTDLLKRMEDHLARYQVDWLRAEVEGIEPAQAGFEVLADGARVRAKAVILATGAIDRRPSMSDADHAAALRQGLLRYCPICDGYEVIGKAIGVLGEGTRLYGEAKFLRCYTSAVTAFSESGSLGLSDDQRRELTAMGILILDEPASAYRLGDGALEVRFGGRAIKFESVYAALGSEVRSRLAIELGAKVTEEGCLVIDAHQRTSVPGLYAAGDVVIGVDQIGHAIGQATVAATALRNDLCERELVLR